MSTNVFGVKIYLSDRFDPVAGNATIGLYNRRVYLAETLAQGSYYAQLATTSELELYDPVDIVDVSGSEHNIIASISYSGSAIALKNASSCTFAASGHVQADSVFRWIQNDVQGLGEDWKSGMLVEDGINPFSKSIKIDRGGNVASAGKGGVIVKNTARFNKTCQDLSIYFNGLTAKIYEFSGVVKTSKMIGVCENPTWNTRKFKIPIEGGLYTKRIMNMGTFINSNNFQYSAQNERGGIVPITFGKHTKAKLFRVENNKEELVIDPISTTFNCASGPIIFYPGTQEYGSVSAFPVTKFYGTDDDNELLTYYIRLHDAGATWSIMGDDEIELLDFKPEYNGRTAYLRVISGAGAGQLRKIESVFGSIPNQELGALYRDLLKVTVSEYFTTALAGNQTASAENQSWVKIEWHDRSYCADVWPCDGFNTTAGAPVINSNEIDIYSYDDSASANLTTGNIGKKTDDFVYVPSNIASAQTTGNKNTLDVNMEFSNGDVDNVDSFLILPPDDVGRITDGTLYRWRPETDWVTWTRNTVVPGYYYLTNRSPIAESASTDFKEVFTDKKYSTAYIAQCESPASGYAQDMFSFYIKLPEPPEKFDEAYLLFDINVSAVNDTGSFFQVKVMSKSIIANATLLKVTQAAVPRRKSLQCVNFLDNYYYDMPDNKNKYFYQYEENGSATEDNSLLYSGYQQVSLGTSVEDYKKISTIGFFVRPNKYYAHAPSTITIRQIAVAFKKSSSVKDAVYSNFSGRVFNSTWGGRKTATDLIESPVDIIEHVCRLQNGNENDIAPTIGWGKSYWDNALIKISGDGSFDDTTDSTMNYIKGLKFSSQILEHDKAFTDKIKKRVCQEARLISYVDGGGNECLKTIKKKETSPTEIITLSDVMDRQSIEIIEPSPSDIYAEPFVRYKKNYATGKFEETIEVTNASYDNPTDEQKESFVHGVTGIYAKTLWDKCHQLYLRSQNIEKPPTDMTDLEWITTESDARDYLLDWIDWMFNPTVKFKTHYNKVASWQEGQRFTLTLPHQTGGAAIECVLTELTIDPNGKHECSVRAIMFSDTIPEDFNLQDSMDLQGENYNWQDHMQTYAERGEGLDDRQDVM